MSWYGSPPRPLAERPVEQVVVRTQRLPAHRPRQAIDVPGACAWLRFSLSGSGTELWSAEIAGALGFVTRDHLDRQISSASDGNLHLDP